MKLSKITSLAVIGLVMASCSNETPGLNNEPAEGQSGYAVIAFNLPETSGTRAVTYEQGTPSEYGVANGKALIFQKGDTEMNSTFLCASNLAGMNWSSASAGEITSTSKGVARLDEIRLNDDAYQYGVIIVLNYTDDFTFPAQGQKLSAWLTTPQSSNMLLNTPDGDFITMTSAAKYAGSNAEPVILADIDKKNIYQTETQALAATNVAGTAYVQRNLAKVSLKESYAQTIAEGSFKGDQVKIKSWNLDVTNKTTYPAQVTAGLKDTYSDIWKGGDKLDRFFGGDKFKRVFWAKDPNYDKEIKTQDQINANFNVLTSLGEDETAAYRYALENTFDINHQMQGQTTRVLIRANYKPQGFSDNETFYKLGNDTRLWKEADLQAEILKRAKSSLNSTDVSVDLGALKGAGLHALNEADIKKGSSKVSANDYDAIARSLGIGNASDKCIGCYLNGVSYYVVRIKHFGDSDCPWDLGDPTYAGNNLKYLGRYGMVRNNWYEVNVTSISSPGYPAIPVLDAELPDDENQYFIAVSINLLSWAKRVQNSDL